MKGLMLQEEMTVRDALKIMEEGQKVPNRLAPMVPPRVLGMCNCFLYIYNYTRISIWQCRVHLNHQCIVCICLNSTP